MDSKRWQISPHDCLNGPHHIGLEDSIRGAAFERVASVVCSKGLKK